MWPEQALSQVASEAARQSAKGRSQLQHQHPADGFELLHPNNLVAWCIVPFDSQKRGPAERSQMLVDLGIRRCAYDWREEQVPSFEEEILQYQKHGIEMTAFWGQHEFAFELFQKYDLHPQIWQMIGDPGGDANTKVERAAKSLVPLAQRTESLQLPLALYNHMGWDGEPENMVAVCQRLHAWGYTHVGIVYNFHHGHDHIERWPSALASMLPYLLCINLNGMNNAAQPKILNIGQGMHERAMIQTLVDSGYCGPVGIIDHRPELDAKQALQENLAGLKSLSLNPKSTSEATPLSSSRFKGFIPEFANLRVDQLIGDAGRRGSADRGAAVFASDHTACLSCHAAAAPDGSLLGGQIGPDLAQWLPTRTQAQIIESLLWPERQVAADYQLWRVLTDDGTVHTGYKLSQDAQAIHVRDLATGQVNTVAIEQVEAMQAMGTPMPPELTSRLTGQQQLDLIAYLFQLRDGRGPSPSQLDTFSSAPRHGPAKFPVEKSPLQPANWPYHTAHVNRGRVYDFYTKQAEYFRQLPGVPLLLQAHPGLDGGADGHWGNQSDKNWADGRWNQTQLGSVQCGVFHGAELTIARAVCVQLGENGDLACCYDPDTLSYRAIWSGGFVGFSEFRHGFLDGLQMQGQIVAGARPVQLADRTPNSQANADNPSDHKTAGKYLGFYRIGQRVAFAVQIGQDVYLDSPWLTDDGQFTNELALLDQHSLGPAALRGGDLQWPQVLATEIILGQQRPLAVDIIQLPIDNPWRSLMFCAAHDFLPDGSALVSTMQGDVWHVSGLHSSSNQARWKRFATGLHHPLGLLVDQQGIFVQCRDHLVRLVDHNQDGEADYYQCYSNAQVTSAAGHDFICGLQRDADGNFYMASGNQGVVRISSDGRQAQIVAAGFRNPDGLGILPDGTLTVPCSEGDWTPASMICAIRPAMQRHTDRVPHFGFRGPIENRPPELPLAYLPRGLDNSSGEQTAVPSNCFGPLGGKSLHWSFGAGSWFTLLVDEVDGQLQGAVVPMAGEFLSGVHRGRFSPADGQCYVSGMAGWGTYTKDDGCFQRIRYTGDNFQQPVGFHVHRNGVVVEFALPLDAEVATDVSSHFAQAWNYRYSGAYGSPELSPSHPGVAGHDPLTIIGAHPIATNRLFLEMPDLQPVSQLHLRMHVNLADSVLTTSPVGAGHDLFITVHRLDQDFADYPSYAPIEKTIAAHPLLVDMAQTAAIPKNRWLQKRSEDAQKIVVKTGKNLTFQQAEIHVLAGQELALTLSNPDVVPHNWVLVRPGQLQAVGTLANQLIASPDAYARHYIPESPAVIVHTDVVPPESRQTIHFQAPDEPGRYPYLCTFPGHWMVMNGVLVVE
ncbi:MAG: heme-binding domain-containing protein [Pirellulaceae bacterium]|nr:heme-binding domain-containing protein [Pirellulaceae bacterium]